VPVQVLGTRGADAVENGPERREQLRRGLANVRRGLLRLERCIAAVEHGL
jgi:hypothetical protein